MVACDAAGGFAGGVNLDGAREKAEGGDVDHAKIAVKFTVALVVLVVRPGLGPWRALGRFAALVLDVAGSKVGS